jgi:hypothetical protein
LGKGGDVVKRAILFGIGWHVSVVLLLCAPSTSWACGEWKEEELQNEHDGDGTDSDFFWIYDEDLIWDDKIGSGDGGYEAEHDSSSCSAHAWGYGNISSDSSQDPIVNGCSQTSYSIEASALADYAYQLKHYWEGPLPREERSVNLDASGGGTQQYSATCSVDQGAAASASCDGSGSCSSISPCDADLNMPDKGVQVRYNAAEESLEAQGHIGGNVEDTSAEFAYSYKQSQNWATYGGGGAQSGSSSYTVLSSRKYTGDTDVEYICAYEGDATAEGACAWEWSGDYSSSVSFGVTAAVDLTIPE